MGTESVWHWIIVIGVVLLLFGRGKVSDLMGDVAQGIKAFKKSMAEEEPVRTEPSRTASEAGDHSPATPTVKPPPESPKPG